MPLVLVNGVANDQASMSSRMGVRGSARGMTMECGLRVDARDATYMEGEGAFEVQGSRQAQQAGAVQDVSKVELGCGEKGRAKAAGGIWIAER